MDYHHKTEPFPHQRSLFERTRDLPAFGFFWEMGCGKTKPTIDTMAWLYEERKINGALILAPKSVAPNWVADELPKHLPDTVMCRTRVFLWRTDKANTQSYQRELKEVLAHDGFLIVVMSYDAIMTGTPDKAFRVKNIRGAMKGCHFARKLLETRSCMMVADESARIKDPNTKRTKRVLAASKYAPFRRALTGTPVANSPFDVFAQVMFLDPQMWYDIGCRRFEAFKNRFGIWVEHVRSDNGQRFKQLVDYKNLDQLNQVVDQVGSRLLKDDVLDLPPKLYEKRHFDMSKEQAKLYGQIRDEFMVFLESGDMITAPLVITRMLRLQQVTSGYCPTDDGGLIRIDPNPRLACLMELVEDCPHQMIVWAKFHEDIDQIMAALAARDITAVSYDGRTKHAERERAREEFQAGRAKVFVGNPAAAGEGLTLHAAQTVVYYNVSFRLTDRLQSEDRAHRIGQEHSVTYVDIVASGTVDVHIVRALRDKQDLAAIVTGDKIKDWI
jgi:SNF2 family DNA or RNA helicase